MKRFLSLTVILGFLAVAGARALGAGQSAATMPDDVKRIFETKCAACHKGKYPPRGLSLERESLPASVVGVSSGEQPDLKLVDPGKPEASYLLRKVRGAAGITGKTMPPPPKDPLAAGEIELLEEWSRSLVPETAAIVPAGPVDPGPEAVAGPPAGRKRPYDKPAFWGTRVVNLPTTTTMDKGDFLFRVSHRFVPPTSAGVDEFWGLDGPATVFVGLGYGITDRLGLSVGRTGLDQEWNLTLSWLAVEQGLAAGLPFSAAVHGGIDWATMKREGHDLFDGGNFKAHAAVSISRQCSSRFSLLAVPAVATNTDHWDASSRTNFALGLAARYMILEDLSLMAEWIPVLSGYKTEGGENGWGLAVEKKIGGHVFQIFVTNAFGLTPSQVLTGGDLKLGKGDFRLGFNIFRTF